MKGNQRWSVFVAAVAMTALATFLVPGQVGQALAEQEGGLGDKIAGTYVVKVPRSYPLP